MVEGRKQLLCIIVGGIVIVLSVVVIVITLQPKKIEMALISKGSGEVFMLKVAPGAKFPMVNPKTGTKDLYRASKVKCQKCGWEGYIIPSFEPGRPFETTCPKCGAERRFLLTL